MAITHDPTFEPAMRTIVRDVMREELAQAPIIVQLQADMVEVKTELSRQGGLLESLIDEISNLAQLVGQALGNNRMWGDNEHRLDEIDGKQKLLIKTVSEYSRKLAT